MTGPGAGGVALLLLRHAQAADREAWPGDDDLRPLTEKGRRQAARVGELLAGAGVRVDAVLTSPLVRARQTAEIVAAELGIPSRLETRLGEPLDLSLLEKILREAGDPAVALLVGHDPDFSELAGTLVGAPLLMRKGALARIDAERPLTPLGGELRWLVPPDLLRS